MTPSTPSSARPVLESTSLGLSLLILSQLLSVSFDCIYILIAFLIIEKYVSIISNGMKRNSVFAIQCSVSPHNSDRRGQNETYTPKIFLK